MIAFALTPRGRTMAHVLFAQSVGEYGGASGAGSSLARIWSEIVLSLRDVGDTTWIVVGAGAAAAVLWWLMRR
jgi:hypothetical protein